jgi:hypothetical protein
LPPPAWLRGRTTRWGRLLHSNNDVTEQLPG